MTEQNQLRLLKSHVLPALCGVVLIFLILVINVNKLVCIMLVSTLQYSQSCKAYSRLAPMVPPSGLGCQADTLCMQIRNEIKIILANDKHSSLLKQRQHSRRISYISCNTGLYSKLFARINAIKLFTAVFQVFIISWSICPWQAFPARPNI